MNFQLIAIFEGKFEVEIVGCSADGKNLKLSTGIEVLARRISLHPDHHRLIDMNREAAENGEEHATITKSGVTFIDPRMDATDSVEVNPFCEFQLWDLMCFLGDCETLDI